MIEIEPARFRQLAASLFESGYREGTTLSPDEAATIVGIAQLAIDADKREESEELDQYDELAQYVCWLASIEPGAIQDAEALKPRGDDDRAARMKTLVAKLPTKPARELAYAIAYVLTIADLDIQPSEDDFLDELQTALAIDDDREEVLMGIVNEMIAGDD